MSLHRTVGFNVQLTCCHKVSLTRMDTKRKALESIVTTGT